MAQTASFFLERAEEAAREARSAELANVRERALRSEAAWRAMADRATKVQTLRKRKAEEAEAEGEAGQKLSFGNSTRGAD